MNQTDWEFRQATVDDIPELFELINKAYEIEAGDVRFPLKIY
jgi:hypothetical protein